MIGKNLAHYEILESLGTGGMGDVYLARDTRLDRKVALKTLRAEGADSPRLLARLRREARAAAALNHPGVVTVHSVEEADGILFITMEHVEGRTLQHVIEPGGMSASSFREVAGQIANAVAAAHAAGIVHRDLKPGNVMLDARDRIKVLDFGLARIDLPETGDDDPTLPVDDVTLPGAVMGTMPYMSPEQVRGAPVDIRSDVFSLGAVFYEMATGSRPFVADSSAELTSAILRDAPRPVAELRPGFPGEFTALIERCLGKDPDDRFADAGEVAAALEVQPETAAVTAPDSGSREGEPVLGVLDFENITGAADADWLATGIAETVNVDLNRLPGLQVVTREQMVAAWSGQEKRDEAAALAVGRRLGLDYLITGAFQKLGERIRITGQMLDVAGNRVAGAIKLDGDMADIFDLQDRVLESLLAGARLPVASGGLADARPRKTGQLAAYELYSRAKGLLLHMGVAAFDEAEIHLREALKLDPDYAVAHTAFAQMRAMRYISTTDKRDLEEAIEHLEIARRVDPELDEPWMWLAYCFGRQDRFEEAIAAGERAIVLNASRPQAHYFTGVAHWMRGASNYEPGDWEAAERHLRRAAKLQPTYQPAFMGRFDVLFRMGRLKEARQAAEMAAELEAAGNWEFAKFVGAETQLGLLELAEGNPDQAERHLRVSERRMEGSVHVYAPLFQVMNVYGFAMVASARGNHAQAVELLRAASELGEKHPRSLGMGRVLSRIGYALAAALARTDRSDEAVIVLNETERFFTARDHFDFSGVWMNFDADILMESVRAHEALGQEDLAAAARAAARENGWPT